VNIPRNQMVMGMVLLVVGLIGGAVIGCAANSDADQAADVAKVQEVWDEYAAAVNAGDFERWIALWIDDGLRLPPPVLGSRQVGKEEIQAAMQPMFDSSDQTAIINVEDVQILGDRAYSQGTFDITVTPKEGGDTLVLGGSFLTILEKQDDGSWKIAIDCFNSSTNGQGGFPTGTFVSASGRTKGEFHADGTCRWYSDVEVWEVPCKYAVNGNLYTEMTFEWGTGVQAPATYYWTYDGEKLTFELWGEDVRPHRKSVYSLAYVKAE
jgi:uncharacterized protein (TIGR02246 family)